MMMGLNEISALDAINNLSEVDLKLVIKILGEEKEASKIAPKKGAPPDSNQLLFQCQEAPGEAASRAHCSDKKQLFEQQLKHCSKFLQKKNVKWIRNLCNNLTGLLNRCKKLNGLLKT